MALSDAAPRLAKLLPMLSSDKAGEVVAAASAIGRTLASVGCDWHDLADRIGTTPPPFVSTPTPRPAAHQPAPPPPEPKWQAPWPTYSRLKQSQRVDWLEAAEKRSAWIMDKKTLAAFIPLKRKMVQQPHELLSRKEINLFNRIVKTMWLTGVRVD